MKLVIFSTLIFLLACQSGFTQIKFEREYSIKTEEVPPIARLYIAAFNFPKKIKWYKEISQNGKSFEAKTKFQKKCFSIEFDEDGNLEDIEIIMAWKEIPEPTRNQIKAALENQFQSNKIKKIQIQYTGESETIRQVAKGETTQKKYETNYEMIIKGKQAKEVKQYEFLFSEKGVLIEKLVIELRNTDNLEY